MPLARPTEALPSAFVLARAAAWLGAASTFVAVPILVYGRTGSPLATGLAAALEATPYLLVGLWAGALADRRDPVVLIRRTALLSTAVLTATVVGVLLAPGPAGTLILLAGTAATTALSAFADAAGFAVLPRLVDRPAFARANGRLATIGLTAQLAGPLLAAALLATGADVGALLPHAALMLIVAAAIGRVRPGSPTTAAPSSPATGATIGEGLRFVRDHPVVGPLTLAGAASSLTVGGVLGLLAVYGHEALGWDRDSGRTAALYVAVAGGGLLASLLAPRLVHRRSPTAVGVGGLALSLVGLVLLAAAPSPSLSAVWLLGWQLAIAVVVLNGIVVRQLSTPLPLQARVGVSGRMLAWGTQPIGALAAGAATERWGVQTAFALLTIGSLVAIATLAIAALARPELRRPTPAVVPDR